MHGPMQRIYSICSAAIATLSGVMSAAGGAGCREMLRAFCSSGRHMSATPNLAASAASQPGCTCLRTSRRARVGAATSSMRTRSWYLCACTQRQT